MMCKQTVCIKWWVAVIVGFLLDIASRVLRASKVRRFCGGPGVLPRKILRSQSRMVAFGGGCGTN